MADYRSAGVKLVWVVSPKSRTVVIRRLDGTCAEVGATGQLSGDLLPYAAESLRRAERLDAAAEEVRKALR